MSKQKTKAYLNYAKVKRLYKAKFNKTCSLKLLSDICGKSDVKTSWQNIQNLHLNGLPESFTNVYKIAKELGCKVEDIVDASEIDSSLDK